MVFDKKIVAVMDDAYLRDLRDELRIRVREGQDNLRLILEELGLRDKKLAMKRKPWIVNGEYDKTKDTRTFCQHDDSSWCGETCFGYVSTEDSSP